MDYSVEKQKRVAELLQTLHMEEVVHPTQFVIGFKRLFESLPSLRCDVPAADAILNGFVAHGKRTGYLPATYVPPRWMDAHTSEDDDEDGSGDGHGSSPLVPAGFTAEMAEQMQEFPVCMAHFKHHIARGSRDSTWGRLLCVCGSGGA